MHKAYLLWVVIVVLGVVTARRKNHGAPSGDPARNRQNGQGGSGHLSEGRARRGRGDLPDFMRMLRGRYDNSEIVLKHNGDADAEDIPRITLSFIPVDINQLPPSVTGVFFQAEVQAVPQLLLFTFEQVGQRRKSYIRGKVWILKNKFRFTNAWDRPDLFLNLRLNNRETEDLLPLLNCTLLYKRQEDGTFISNGTDDRCRSPGPDGMYKVFREITLANGLFTYETSLHAANGREAKRIRLTLNKVEDDPLRPLNASGVMESLMAGATANYRLDLSLCEVQSENGNVVSTPSVLGGPIDEFQYIPVGVFGPLAYLRAASYALIVADDSRILRITTIQVMDHNNLVKFSLKDQPLGAEEVATPKQYECTLNSGPRGLPVIVLRQPNHWRQLQTQSDILMALQTGHGVRMTVDLSLCDRGDNGTDIITLGATTIRDYDVVETHSGRDLNFNSVAVGDSVCSPTNTMMSGATVSVHQSSNTVTVHQWGIHFLGWQACFQTRYECGISSATQNEGTAFYML